MSLKVGDVFYLSRPWPARTPAGEVLLPADTECIVAGVVKPDLESQQELVRATAVYHCRTHLLAVSRIFCVPPENRYLLWLIAARRSQNPAWRLYFACGITVTDLRWPTHLVKFQENAHRVLWQANLGISMIKESFDLLAPCSLHRLHKGQVILVEHIWGHKVVEGKSVGDATDFHLEVLMYLMGNCSCSLVVVILRASCVERLLQRFRDKGGSLPRRWKVMPTVPHYTPLRTGSDTPVQNGVKEMVVVVRPICPDAFGPLPCLERPTLYIPRLLLEAGLRNKKILQIAAGRLDSTVAIAEALHRYCNVYDIPL